MRTRRKSPGSQSWKSLSITNPSISGASAEERAIEGIGQIPQSLAEAIDVMEGSEIVAEALGEHVFDYFIRNTREEWAQYKAQVTPWEIDRYLGSL